MVGNRLNSVQVSLLGVMLATAVAAGAETRSQTIALLEGQALSHAKGVIGVNQAAGDLNLQSNDRAIAVAATDGLALAETLSIQSWDGNGVSAPVGAVAKISDSTFENTIGTIAINQASGAGNRQVNVLVVSHGGMGLDDDFLATTHAIASSNRGESDLDVVSRRQVSVGPAAFHGAKGVLQLNQVTGGHNISANRLELQGSPR